MLNIFNKDDDLNFNNLKISKQFNVESQYVLTT
jgi:hypothetical protein